VLCHVVLHHVTWCCDIQYQRNPVVAPQVIAGVTIDGEGS
jgi:hypothetical protein